MSNTSKPQYRTLVKALDDLRHLVDWKVLNPLSPKEIRDSYRELAEVSTQAEKLVNRAKMHMKASKENPLL